MTRGAAEDATGCPRAPARPGPPGTVEVDAAGLDLEEIDRVRLTGSSAFGPGPFIRYDPPPPTD